MNVNIILYKKIEKLKEKKIKLRGLMVNNERLRRKMRWMKRIGYKGI